MRMPIPCKLSDAKVKTAKPKLKPYKLSDGAGLFLLVNPNAGKYWRLKYRFNGKEKSLALGVYPYVSLAKARELTYAARERLADGVDPSRFKVIDKIKNQSNVFEKVAKEWWEQQNGKWTEEHAKRVWTTIKKEVLPSLGDIPIHDITPQECLAVIKKVESRDALDVASRVKQRMSAIFNFAIYTSKATMNPVEPLQNVIKTRKVKHMPALPAKQLPAFLKALDSSERITEVVRYGLKLILLTFVRPGEIRFAQWDEFELEEGLWRIPSERTKMNREHIVPLSHQAIDVLGSIKAISENYPYVFPGYHDSRKPMSENALTYAIRRRLEFDATAHGFRALASTTLNENGYTPDVIERQLAHVERNKVRAAYHRSQYLAERKEMMQWWADFLDSKKDLSS